MRVIDVSDASQPPYAHVEVSLGGSSREIRWGLDELTFRHFRRAFQSRPTDAMPGATLDRYILTTYDGSSGQPGSTGYCYLDDVPPIS